VSVYLDSGRDVAPLPYLKVRGLPVKKAIESYPSALAQRQLVSEERRIPRYEPGAILQWGSCTVAPDTPINQLSKVCFLPVRDSPNP